MAAPQKDNLKYFPFDVSFFSDKKIKRLRAKFGNDGICVLIYIYTQVYSEGFYIAYDDDLILDISDELNISENLTRQIMAYLFSRSLLNGTLAESVKVLTAASIQRRYQEAKRTVKRDIVVPAEYWLLSPEETLSFIKVRQNEGFSEKNGSYFEKNPSYSENNDTNKSKVNKSKINKIKEVDSSPANAVFALPLNDGTEYEIAQEEINTWAKLYPSVDVMQELRKMYGWLDANPTRKKTCLGIKRFIVNWLSGEQDKGGKEYKQAEKHEEPKRNYDLERAIEKMNASVPTLKKKGG